MHRRIPRHAFPAYALLCGVLMALAGCVGDLKAPVGDEAGSEAASGSGVAALQQALTQRVYVPEADAWTNSRYPSTNYGSSTGLSADLAPDQNRALIRFTVPAMTDSVQTARLRLYVTNGTPNGPKIYLTSNSWTEKGVTWQNQPGYSGSPIADFGSMGLGWFEVDVSNAIKGPGTYSLYVISDIDDGINFHSREAANPPQLVLGTSASGDQCPLDPDKTAPGICGCGVSDNDANGNGIADCKEATNFTFPVRAAFYYPWYPGTWTVNGAHVFYHPTLGYYNSSDLNAIDRHIAMMEHAKINLAIISWWGKGSQADPRVKLLLDRTVALGSKIKWAFYYEKEGGQNPSPEEIAADLDYLLANHGNSPALARYQGKPMVYVWTAGGDTPCEVSSRWSKINRPGWFVNAKLGYGYQTCPVQPDAWHQYGPATRVLYYKGTSFSISAGFWRADQKTPTLPRDIGAYRQAVRDMVASGEKWQYVTTFNEWGEGTAVESATEWASPSGFGLYLDALHTDGQ